MAEQHPTSPTLLDRARALEPDAWSRLVYLYTPLVRHWCVRWSLQGADIDDLTQEIFAAVARGLNEFRRDTPADSFRAWLRGIARNKHIDLLRRRHRHPVAAGGTEALQALGQHADAEPSDDSLEQLSELYHRALNLVRAEFEERTWQAFWSVAIEGQPVDLVARQAGISAAAVRQAKSRVLRRLREEVGDLIA